MKRFKVSCLMMDDGYWGERRMVMGGQKGIEIFIKCNIREHKISVSGKII